MLKEKKFPKYSILMSIYYKEKPEYLEYSINSMLNQTIKPDEFVLVKDGMLTEELDSLILEYVNKYPELFKIVILERNMGLGPALNRGVIECKNEWIARMDADDYSTPYRIEKEFEAIAKNPLIDLIGSNHAEFMDEIEDIKAIKRLPALHNDIVNYARRRNPFSHSSILFKKDKVLKAGNYREYYFVEDYDLWIRMIQSGSICANIDDCLSYVRVSDNLYSRRGGIKYLNSILRFKNEQYKKGFFTFKDYIISSISHIIVCVLPGKSRKFIYERILRR